MLLRGRAVVFHASKQTESARPLTGRIHWRPPARPGGAMRIGLDLDGLLDERPDFFAFLTAALRAAGHFVAVLTYRDPESRAGTEGQLAAWGIAFDELHFARSLSDKGRLCRELDIDLYFDDQDEC